jgi:hypothetical protein
MRLERGSHQQGGEPEPFQCMDLREQQIDQDEASSEMQYQSIDVYYLHVTRQNLLLNNELLLLALGTVLKHS